MRLPERGNADVKSAVRCAMLAAISLAIYVLESCIPPIVPIPGVKMGLANIVTLAAVYIVGAKNALYVLLTRIVLGNIFAGQAVSFVYSLAGGMACWISTVILKRFFTPKTMWALGVSGALFHNAAQLLCAVVMLKSTSVVYYGAALGLASCVTGAFTGLCAQYSVKLIDKIGAK